MEQYGVNEKDVLASYKCRVTNELLILPYAGQDIDNPKDGHKKSLVTVNIRDGVTEEQLNEWYNLLNVYVHAFTSGGQERTIQEAKLAGLITLVTNYSCGEDNCVPEACSIPLSYTNYREGVSNFIKANTNIESIVSGLNKVAKMSKEDVKKMGKGAREWVLNNFSIDVIGAQFEAIIDAAPLTEYDFDFSVPLKNPLALIPNIEDETEWLKKMYKDILLMDVSDSDEGLVNWKKQLEMGVPRHKIDEYFRNVAKHENEKINATKTKPLELLGKPEERVLLNIPESLGDCYYVTSLLEDARETYRNKYLYVACKDSFRDVFLPLEGHLIDKVISWQPEFDNSMALEYGDNKQFQIVLQPHFPTQRMINYLHNGEDTNNLVLQK